MPLPTLVSLVITHPTLILKRSHGQQIAPPYVHSPLAMSLSNGLHDFQVRPRSLLPLAWRPCVFYKGQLHLIQTFINPRLVLLFPLSPSTGLFIHFRPQASTFPSFKPHSHSILPGVESISFSCSKISLFPNDHSSHVHQIVHPRPCFGIWFLRS